MIRRKECRVSDLAGFESCHSRASLNFSFVIYSLEIRIPASWGRMLGRLAQCRVYSGCSKNSSYYHCDYNQNSSVKKSFLIVSQDLYPVISLADLVLHPLPTRTEVPPSPTAIWLFKDWHATCSPPLSSLQTPRLPSQDVVVSRVPGRPLLAMLWPVTVPLRVQPLGLGSDRLCMVETNALFL